MSSSEDATLSSAAGGSEDVVSKYKRLLSMARSSLEANQAQLSAKDQQIAQLVSALEEEKLKRLSVKAAKDDDAYQYPRRILCRVDVEGSIWVLIEFESSPDEWKSFADEQSLQDFIKSIPGVPLTCPQKCLSAEESFRLVEDNKRHVQKVIEEFRRYKVRTEIALKQKSVDTKSHFLQHQSTFSSSSSNNISSSSGLSVSLEKALSSGVSSAGPTDEVASLKQQLAEHDAKWKSAYDKLAKEHEALKLRGAESVVAAQWRSRYETCMKDKQELAQKLDLLLQLSNEVSNSGSSVEQMFLNVQDDYKSLRKRLYEMVHDYRAKEAKKQHLNGFLDRESEINFVEEISRVLEFYFIDQRDFDDSRLVMARLHQTQSVSSPDKMSQEGYVAGKGMADSKVQYVRQMVFQFLACTEPEVKTHIETALISFFRFTDEEKAVIENRKKEESQDALSSFADLWNSFGTSTT